MSLRNRRQPSLRYRKLFLVASEGECTEPCYFEKLRDLSNQVVIRSIPHKHSSPKHVLKAMKDKLKSEPIGENDEAWIIMDKDRWEDSALMSLFNWAEKKNQHHVAISNPCFELWLLLHFEEATNCDTVQKITDKLRRHITAYNKKIPGDKITLKNVKEAILRAKAHDHSKEAAIPGSGTTQVHRLVEKIME